MSELRKINLPFANVLGHINAHLETNRVYYGDLVIRCVSVLQDGVWTNAICLVRAEPPDSVASSTRSMRYANAHLLEERTDLSTLTRIFRELSTGTITVDGEAVSIGKPTELRGWELYPSNNDYSDLPGYLYQPSQSSGI